MNDPPMTEHSIVAPLTEAEAREIFSKMCENRFGLLDLWMPIRHPKLLVIFSAFGMDVCARLGMINVHQEIKNRGRSP